MKRYLNAEILTLAIVTALAGTAFAQSGGRGSSESTSTQSGRAATSAPSATTEGARSGAAASMSRDGIVRHQGQLYFVKEGRAQKIDKELKLSEGITAEKNGKVTLKDGTELTLQEGKMVTLDGKVTETPPQISSTLEGIGGGTSRGTQEPPAE